MINLVTITEPTEQHARHSNPNTYIKLFNDKKPSNLNQRSSKNKAKARKGDGHGDGEEKNKIKGIKVARKVLPPRTAHSKIFKVPKPSETLKARTNVSHCHNSPQHLPTVTTATLPLTLGQLSNHIDLLQYAKRLKEGHSKDAPHNKYKISQVIMCNHESLKDNHNESINEVDTSRKPSL